MRSKWSIKKTRTRGGRDRYEAWYDGEYLGWYPLHEDAWAAILEKRPQLAQALGEPCHN